MKQNTVRVAQTVGRKAKAARVELGIKTKDMANELGIKPASLSYIERRGDTSPFLKYLRILKQNGVDLNDLF